MDTVEAGDGWTVNPFAGTERDGRIYGRGANDMKAGIAIILQTVSTCVRNRGRLRGKIVVAFVCDEEAYSEGVLCAIKEGNIHADFGIAAEPEYHHAVIGSCGKVLTSIDVQLRTSEHRSMYSYVRLSIDRCTATYV